MLTHLASQPMSPTRVVILGARGFVGRALIERVTAQGIPVLGVSSDSIDLATDEADKKLAAQLRPDDSLVFLSAVTPDKGRGIASFVTNMRMGAAVSAALERSPVAHLIYISSDAVYPFRSGLIREASCAEPPDLYGVMHLAREIMLKQTLAKTPIAVLRPTLIYGAQDTHNSYGPNRLRRAAHKDGRITLFGAGEETREFIAVEDVVNLILLVVQHRSCGTLNLATGHPISYAALAKLVAAQFLPNIIEIVDTPRQNPITHRAFDVTAMRSSFPQFILTALEGGLATAHRQEFGAGEK